MFRIVLVALILLVEREREEIRREKGNGEEKKEIGETNKGKRVKKRK